MDLILLKERLERPFCWRDKRLNQWKDRSAFLGEKQRDTFDAKLWANLGSRGYCIGKRKTKSPETHL